MLVVLNVVYHCANRHPLLNRTGSGNAKACAWQARSEMGAIQRNLVSMSDARLLNLAPDEKYRKVDEQRRISNGGF